MVNKTGYIGTKFGTKTFHESVFASDVVPKFSPPLKQGIGHTRRSTKGADATHQASVDILGKTFGHMATSQRRLWRLAEFPLSLHIYGIHTYLVTYVWMHVPGFGQPFPHITDIIGVDVASHEQDGASKASKSILPNMS